MDKDDKDVTTSITAENTTPVSANSTDDSASAVEATTPTSTDSTEGSASAAENTTPASKNLTDDSVAVIETTSLESTNSTDDSAPAAETTAPAPESTNSTDDSAPAAETTAPAPESTTTTDAIVEENTVKPIETSENENNPKTDEPVKLTTDETPISNTSSTDTNDDASKHTEENVDFTDAMMENLQDNFNQDVDSMVSLMESAEEFMFESDDKQLNIKAAIEANKRKKELESKSVINSDKSEAYSLLAQGKRNLFVKDYESAVTTLGEACQKLNTIYGEFAVEVADAYMTYGNALLELWRIEEADKKNNEGENGEILENVQEGNEDENDEENGDESTADDKDADESENISDEKKENEEGDEGDEDKENDENNEDGEEDIENEEDNLQIAWEVVELAKQIYIRHNDNVNLAKAYLKLAEISIASGNYDLSVEDLNRSLDIQNNMSPVDNRLKANTHFNLYVAYSASHNYDKSGEHLDIAKSVFETQVDDLGKKLKTIDKSSTAEISKIMKEISDTEDIIKDMDSKVLENFKHKREFLTALVEAIKNKTEDPSQSNGSASSKDASSSNNLLGVSSSKNVLVDSSSKTLFGGTSSSNVPVNNITNLIRKKPKEKTEPSADTNQSPSKPNTAVNLNGESSIVEKTESKSNSESLPSTNGANVKEKQEDQESNVRKRKASESCDSSPKKVCLENE